MGIRFRCPNGHKLNVKDFLAGKRGICPDCGVKLQIPPRSDAEFLDGKPPGAAGTSATQPTATPVSAPIAAKNPAANENARDVANAATGIVRPPGQGSPSASHGSLDLPRMVAPVDSSYAATITPPAPKPADVDANQQTAPLWYVRPPSGGQFGPASDDIFQSWLAEGRVTGDSYVWREGWEDWKRASETLSGIPEPLAPQPTPAPAGSPVAEPTAPLIDLGLATNRPVVDIKTEPPKIVETEDRSDGSRPELYRKRKSTKMVTAMIVVLTLACVMLFALLVYVVQ